MMKQEVDLLIKDVLILPIVPKGLVIKKGFIAISEGRIVDFGPMEKASDFIGREILKGKGLCALPGLINTHTHAPMTLLRGVGDGLPLDKWLNEEIWPREAKLTEEDIYWGTMLACLEMIRSGTTCFVDMYLKEDSVAKAVLDSGLRAFLSYGMIDLGQKSKKEEELRITKDFVMKWHGTGNGRIKCMIAPHAPYTCSQELLLDSKVLAKEMGLMLNIHLSETREEVRIVKRLTGRRPVEYLDFIGFLGPEVLAAHCVWLSDEEIRILAKKGVSVSHCPSSNSKLGSGIAPVREMLSYGVNVSIGTDGCASNDDMDMFEEMRLACFLQRARLLDPTVLNAVDAIEMATINAAYAIGMMDEIGSIQRGKRADLILIVLNIPKMVPLNDLITNIVFSASGNSVRYVIVNGKILMKEGRVTSVNQETVIREVMRRKIVPN